MKPLYVEIPTGREIDRSPAGLAAFVSWVSLTTVLQAGGALRPTERLTAVEIGDRGITLFVEHLTEHPCKGMTREQIEAFERIAISEPPACTKQTLDALIKAGKVVRRPGRASQLVVPIAVHAQWCKWCSELSGDVNR